MLSDALGYQSYHFETDTQGYVSFEHEELRTLELDDGSELPARMPFEATSYDTRSRTFTATVSWAPTSFLGDSLWEFELVFDPMLEGIVGGQLHHFTPGVTDRSSPEQVCQYVDSAPTDA